MAFIIPHNFPRHDQRRSKILAWRTCRADAPTDKPGVYLQRASGIVKNDNGVTPRHAAETD